MPANGLSLELTRLMPAPRARVFDCFARADLLARWWGPNGFSIPAIDFVPRVGETYRIEMQPPDGDAFELTGTFREVAAPSRLAFTFRWEPADPDDDETVAQLEFETIDQSTRVILRQGPFRTEARRELHREGWSESLDRLAGVVTQSAP
jgi:uncharacterized protein YndB with AHSA1/START domain